MPGNQCNELQDAAREWALIPVHLDGKVPLGRSPSMFHIPGSRQSGCAVCVRIGTAVCIHGILPRQSVRFIRSNTQPPPPNRITTVRNAPPIVPIMSAARENQNPPR